MMCWLCLPKLRLLRDPFQHKTITRVGEAANRHLNRPELTPEDLAWIDELSSDSEEEGDEENQEGGEENSWGELKEHWQSIIRSGLHPKPQDRPTMDEVYFRLFAMKNSQPQDAEEALVV